MARADPSVSNATYQLPRVPDCSLLKLQVPSRAVGCPRGEKGQRQSQEAKGWRSSGPTFQASHAAQPVPPRTPRPLRASPSRASPSCPGPIWKAGALPPDPAVSKAQDHTVEHIMTACPVRLSLSCCEHVLHVRVTPHDICHPPTAGVDTADLSG